MGFQGFRGSLGAGGVSGAWVMSRGPGRNARSACLSAVWQGNAVSFVPGSGPSSRNGGCKGSTNSRVGSWSVCVQTLSAGWGVLHWVSGVRGSGALRQRKGTWQRWLCGRAPSTGRRYHDGHVSEEGRPWGDSTRSALEQICEWLVPGRAAIAIHNPHLSE